MHVYIQTMSVPQRCHGFSGGQYTLLQVLAHHPGWGRILNETESRAFVVKVVQTTDSTTEETVLASAGRDKVTKMSTCPTNSQRELVDCTCPRLTVFCGLLHFQARQARSSCEKNG